MDEKARAEKIGKELQAKYDAFWYRDFDATYVGNSIEYVQFFLEQKDLRVLLKSHSKLRLPDYSRFFREDDYYRTPSGIYIPKSEKLRSVATEMTARPDKILRDSEHFRKTHVAAEESLDDAQEIYTDNPAHIIFFPPKCGTLKLNIHSSRVEYNNAINYLGRSSDRYKLTEALIRKDGAVVENETDYRTTSFIVRDVKKALLILPKRIKGVTVDKAVNKKKNIIGNQPKTKTTKSGYFLSRDPIPKKAHKSDQKKKK